MANFFAGFENEIKRMVGMFLSSSDWLVTRHRDQVEGGSSTSLTSDEYTELLSYRQYLRELSAQTDFDADTFVFREFALRDRYCEAEYLGLAHLFQTY